MKQLEIRLSLFQTEISRSRLPRGIVTGAEVRIEEVAGKVEIQENDEMQAYFMKERKKVALEDKTDPLCRIYSINT